MKTYIIDWNPKDQSCRYALIQAKCLKEAFWKADSIGSPFKIAELVIAENEEEEGVRYMEVDVICNPRAKSTLNDCNWEQPGDILGDMF